MNLNQVTLPARDLATAVAFYQRLGLRLIVDALPRYARFECPDGESTLSLEHSAELGSGPAPVVFLECDDLDGTVQRLMSEGIRFDSPPTDQPWLWREARLRDPAGNSLCLFRAASNRRNPPWQLEENDAVSSAEDRFFGALLEADGEALDALLTPDFVLVDVMTGSEIPGAVMRELVAGRQLVFDTIERIESRVRAYDSAAVVTGQTRMRGRYQQQTWSAHSRYTHVYVRGRSGWQLASAQGTPIAAAT